jgi:hypothetical protein
MCNKYNSGKTHVGRGTGGMDYDRNKDSFLACQNLNTAIFSKKKKNRYIALLHCQLGMQL